MTDAPLSLAQKKRAAVNAPTIGAMTDHICSLALRRRAFRWWIFAMIPALLLLAILVGASAWLFYAGVGIWGVTWPTVWGFALINYVWWIAIASGGTFISALFYLTRAEWRTSLSRIAETMTVFAAACAAIYPILHLGRPWLFYWLFPFPNTMTLWPQFRSPLLWDFFAILTYVIASIVFWYFGLIPDLATMRDCATTRAKQRFYGVLALGFRGSDRQWRHYHSAYGVLATIMAPLVISVHSIVGLDFAGAATPGWHSTQFPPFFVFGALLSGFAMVLLLIIPLRRLMELEAFITEKHLDILGKMLLTSSLCVAYAYMMDAFTIFYGGDFTEKYLFIDKIQGAYAPVYWATIVFNVLAPQLLWRRASRQNAPLMMIISFGVIIGMWCERYTIVVMSLRRTHLPAAWGEFHASFWDWATFAGTVGLFAVGLLVAVRVVPVLSMFELRARLAGEHEERRQS